MISCSGKGNVEFSFDLHLFCGDLIMPQIVLDKCFDRDIFGVRLSYLKGKRRTKLFIKDPVVKFVTFPVPGKGCNDDRVLQAFGCMNRKNLDTVSRSHVSLILVDLSIQNALPKLHSCMYQGVGTFQKRDKFLQIDNNEIPSLHGGIGGKDAGLSENSSQKPSNGLLK